MSYKLSNEDSQKQFASDVRSGLFDVFNDKVDAVAYYKGAVVGFASAGSLVQAVEMGQNKLDQSPLTKGLSPDFAIEVTPEMVSYFKEQYPMSQDGIDKARLALENASHPVNVAPASQNAAEKDDGSAYIPALA